MVTGVSIAKDDDGRPRGFAFVNMEDPEEGNKAVEALNGYTLHDRQLIEAIGQTVNLARTYGSSYASGLLLFGGGDSGAIQQRELIDELL